MPNPYKILYYYLSLIVIVSVKEYLYFKDNKPIEL